MEHKQSVVFQNTGRELTPCVLQQFAAYQKTVYILIDLLMFGSIALQCIEPNISKSISVYTNFWCAANCFRMNSTSS